MITTTMVNFVYDQFFGREHSVMVTELM